MSDGNEKSSLEAGQERRRARRLYKRFVLRVALFEEKPLKWSHVTIHNLSSTGVLFTFDRQVRQGMLLCLKIDFPDRVIECLGRVVRMVGPPTALFRDVAVHIEGLSAADRSYVQEFVNKSPA